MQTHNLTRDGFHDTPEPTCPRHGGPWGDDETCPRCTTEDGAPRTVEAPALDPAAVLAGFDRWSAECETAGYTDTGEAWEFLDALAGALREAVTGFNPACDFCTFSLEPGETPFPCETHAKPAAPPWTVEDAADRLTAVYENETPPDWSEVERLAYVLTGTPSGLTGDTAPPSEDPELIPCADCGTEFPPRKGYGEFCSEDCAPVDRG